MKASTKIKILSGLLGVSIISCVTFITFWIDMSLLYTDLESSQRCESYSSQIAVKLLEKSLVGLEEQQLLDFIYSAVDSQQETVIVKKDKANNSIWIENIEFKLKDGKLTKVTLRIM